MSLSFGLQPGANLCVARLDDFVDESNALVVGKKGAFHGVDGDLLEVVEVQVEGVAGGLEFFGHGRVAHEAVVGVERDAELLLKENFEGMLGEALCGAGLHVAKKADFERDSLVENVLGQVAQFHHFAVFRNSDVVNQACAMADAMRATILDGLPDRFFAKTLAGMNGNVEILALDVMEGVDVFFGRVATLFAG